MTSRPLLRRLAVRVPRPLVLSVMAVPVASAGSLYAGSRYLRDVGRTSSDATPVRPAGGPPAHAATTARDVRPAPGSERMWIEMRNVDLRVQENVVFRVRRLHGEVFPTTDGPVSLDNPKSFSVHIVSGTVSLTGGDLTTLLNKVVFADPAVPLKQLTVRTRGAYIVQTGVLHKGIDLPFEMTASLGVVPDGRVRMHPVQLRILGVDGARFLHAAGMRLEQLLDLSRAHGASVHGDDIYLDVTRAVPPPYILGRLASVRVRDGEVTEEFVRLPDDSVFGAAVRPDSTIPNFVYFRGGNLRFGKLSMLDTDLLIADANVRDPFDLYLARYSEQLVRGTSRTLPDFGLIAVMPDYAAARR